MCCLFGLIHCRRTLTAKQKNRLIFALAEAAEARGTDATGIAYNAGGRLRIYKRPWPAHLMRFHIPADVATVMGHTRMTTQGSQIRNRNNHPFPGQIGKLRFALAHNGVLFNDRSLRRSLHLPETNVETDSYVAVQLIEREKALGFDSLRSMAEKVEGSFSFSILNDESSLYLVKGDSPLVLVRFPALDLYIYASTKEILEQALEKARLSCWQTERVDLCCGDILRIDATGALSRQWFDATNLMGVGGWYGMPRTPFKYSHPAAAGPQDPYLEELRSVAPSFGYTPEAIDRLFAAGMEPEEIEDFLCCGGCGEL